MAARQGEGSEPDRRPREAVEACINVGGFDLPVDDQDEEAGPTPIVLPNVAPVAGAEPDDEDVESGEDSMQAVALLEEKPQQCSTDDQLLGIFEEEAIVYESLDTLTSLVEDVTGGEMLDEVQALMEEMERL